MKKILACIIILAMLCCTLISCDNTQKQDTPEESAQEMIDKADAALLEAPYKLTMTMDFDCNNLLIDEALSMLNMEIPTIIDGSNMFMDYSMNVMGYEVAIQTTLVDNAMYYNMDMMGQTVKMKCILTEEQYQQFAENNNTEMPLSVEQFADMRVEQKDGKTYIYCDQINEEGINELNGQLADSLSSLGAEAAFEDLTYYFVLADGKYESMNMDCDYTMTMEGETYTISMMISTKFDYNGILSVTVPADSNEYIEVNYEDIMGE